MRIVIADDEAIIRLGLKSMLEQMGHRVVGAAGDGIGALDMVRAQQPDLVILDIKMPRLDGLDAAEAIVAERPVPILILTAYSDRHLVERAANLAIQGYLVKPINPGELGPALEVAASRFAETQALRQEAAGLRDALETRSLVDMAKHALMEQQGMREEEAFRTIQARARRERRSIRQVSEAILDEAEQEG